MTRNPEGGFSGMESVFSGFVLDPEKCNQLSMEEKRQLVHRIAQWSDDAPKILSSLSRKELLEIICAEMGKERKYSGFTKLRMIEHLLNLVAKNIGTHEDFSPSKKQKKPTGPAPARPDAERARARALVCQNVACRATMGPADAFCRRCSCCVCLEFDDNKDPSLWLTCEPDGPGPGCGVSCHLNCAVGHDRAGISTAGRYPKLDGGFYCVSCGKANGLMRTWRKQLSFAKEARRVDALCLRVLLGRRILEGTVKHRRLLEIVESAVKTLENEVGPIDLAAVKMDRRLVNRLSCCAEVQKLCTFAVEAFDSTLADSSPIHSGLQRIPTCRISFEESGPTSVTIVLDYDPRLFVEFVGCRIWHRKTTLKNYPNEATYIVLSPQNRFKLTDLEPATDYACMVSFFSNKKPLGFWESKWTTAAPSPEVNGPTAPSPEVNGPTRTDSVRSSSNRAVRKVDCSSASFPPCTPCKSDGPGPGPTRADEYEYAVGVVRGLEHDGHLTREFRVRFLTWYSLKATPQQRRVVNVFVDTLVDDPPGLAEQILDTFSDEIRV